MTDYRRRILNRNYSKFTNELVLIPLYSSVY